MKNKKIIVSLFVSVILSGCKTTESDNYDNKTKVEKEVEASVLSADDILDSFINDEVEADGSAFGIGSFKISDIEMNDGESIEGYTVGERVDLDNDGENELILNDIYGGIYLDARDKGVYVLAMGEGTADYLDYMNYENATWIFYSGAFQTNTSYRFEKYQGGDNLVDSFSLDMEFEDNSTKYYINGEEVDYQVFYEKYDSVFPAPTAVDGGDFENSNVADSDITDSNSQPPITAEEFATFKTNPDIQIESGFDDFNDILTQDYLGTWYNPVWNEAIRLTENGAYVYNPNDTSYSDTLYSYQIIDRSDRGLCPELLIEGDNEYFYGVAYYIARSTQGCFYGRDGYFIFYKQ